MWPGIFGPLVHDVLLMVAMAYPHKPNDDQQESMMLLLTHLFKNLPCPQCATHASAYLLAKKPDLSSGEALFDWLVVFHNDVNERTGKRSDWTVEEARKSLLDRHFTDIRNLSRAMSVRVEDHRQIMALKAENMVLRKKLDMPDNDRSHDDYQHSIQSVVNTMAKSVLKNNTSASSTPEDVDIVDLKETGGDGDTYSLVAMIVSCLSVALLVVLMVKVFWNKRVR